MDIRPENNKDTFRGRGKTIEELREQLGALRSIIRQTYKAIGCSDDIIEGEDWGGLPSRVACLKAAVDLGNHQELDILHDRPHKEVGRGRAAKVHRVPTADEIATSQPMTAPTRLEIEWRNIQKVNENE